MIPALVLMLTFHVGADARWIECATTEVHVAAVRCLDASNPWCQGTTAPTPVSCVADRSSMLTLRPASGQVVIACVRVCNGAGCSECVGGDE